MIFEDLQQRLRVEREFARTHRGGTVPLESGRKTGELGSTGELTGRTTSKLSGYLRRLRDRPSSAVLITGVLIVLAGLLYLLHMKLADPPVPFRSMRVAPFTTSGIATRAAISPDGKYVVYVETDLGKQSLWVRQVAVTSNVSSSNQLKFSIADSPSRTMAITFSTLFRKAITRFRSSIRSRYLEASREG